MKFSKFASKVRNQFNRMAEGQLFITSVERDELYDLYLDSYPEGTNEIYKERREADCNHCKQFIRRVGNLVAMVDGKLTTVWDAEGLKDEYIIVAAELHKKVVSASIIDVFFYNEAKISSETSNQLENSSVKTWSHLSCVIPDQFIVPDMATQKSAVRSAVQVCERGLKEISPNVLDIVLDLIKDNNLYRGEEFKPQVENFKYLQMTYQSVAAPELFPWLEHRRAGARIRNSVIGTLLVDLSDGIPLDDAVKMYESKVAPANYKRTTALITPGMIKEAVKTIDSLGLEDALQRRHATIKDISINDVLWASNDSVLHKNSLTNLLMKEVRVSKTKAQEISIDDFMKNVMTEAKEIKLLVRNAQVGNLMSLVAPTNETKNMLQWENNFTWSYNGDVTDSVKARVKAAGGATNEYLRISLSWFNYDDLDIHCVAPDGQHIYFGDKRGVLDVDMNASNHVINPVENLSWTKEQLIQGTYKVYVNNFAKRSNENVGFNIQIEVGGRVTNLTFPAALPNKQNIDVLEFSMVNGTILINPTKQMIQDTAPQNVWGIKTESFTKVETIMLSPNHWGENIGNKHYMFMLDGCKNPKETRGFYTEFLHNDLIKHRKVFEMLGSKFKCPYSDEQLSGVGFSSTKSDTVTLQVDGRNYDVKI